MIEKIDNNQPLIESEASSNQTSPPNIPANNEADASLQVNYDSLIEQAKEIPPEDTDVIQRAQELLLSGQLESPENIRAAAENIIKFGI